MCECELQATARTHLLTGIPKQTIRICTHAEKCLIILIFQNRCLDFIFSSDFFLIHDGKSGKNRQGSFCIEPVVSAVSVSSIAKHSMQNILNFVCGAKNLKQIATRTPACTKHISISNVAN